MTAKELELQEGRRLVERLLYLGLTTDEIKILSAQPIQNFVAEAGRRAILAAIKADNL